MSYTVFMACAAPDGRGEGPLDATVATDMSPASDAVDAALPDAQMGHDARAAVPQPAPPVQLVRLFPEVEDTSECGNTDLPYDFAPRELEFSVRNAFWAMWFAQRAMLHEDPGVQAELRALGFQRFQMIESKDVGLQAFIAARPDVVVLAFRGSSELVDWLGDFNFPQQDGALYGVPGKVHQGFAGALEAVWPALATLVPAYVDRQQPVWVTGHSLGGAEAVLAAVRFEGLGVPIATVYTFGAPRAGNQAFARAGTEALHGRVYRIANDTDLVPRLPPSAAAADAASPIVPIAGGLAALWLRELDYYHPGQLYWFKESTGSMLTVFAPLDESEDVPFWQASSQGGTLGLLLRSPDQGKRHAHQRYLCRLYEAKLAEAPAP